MYIQSVYILYSNINVLVCSTCPLPSINISINLSILQSVSTVCNLYLLSVLCSLPKSFPDCHFWTFLKLYYVSLYIAGERSICVCPFSSNFTQHNIIHLYLNFILLKYQLQVYYLILIKLKFKDIFQL